jgi:hypothetical protein
MAKYEVIFPQMCSNGLHIVKEVTILKGFSDPIFLVVLEFKLGALHLLDRHSTILAPLPALRNILKASM